MKNLLLPGLAFTCLSGLAAQTAPALPPGRVQPTSAQPQHTVPANTPDTAPPPANKQAEVNAPANAGGELKTKPNADAKEQSRRAPYIIGPEDILSIRVWQEPNLSGQVVVGPDGMISMQLIDEVRAEGLTPEQLKALLTERLKAFINNPDVNVQVQRVNSRKFFIQGEVSRPGSFPLTGSVTVMEALVNAAGFREFANTKKIYILRTETDPVTNKTETKKYNFNYKDVSHGKHMEQNILIQNGDQIFVP